MGVVSIGDCRVPKLRDGVAVARGVVTSFQLTTAYAGRICRGHRAKKERESDRKPERFDFMLSPKHLSSLGQISSAGRETIEAAPPIRKCQAIRRRT